MDPIWIQVLVFCAIIIGGVLAIGMANNIRRKRDAGEDQDIYR